MITPQKILAATAIEYKVTPHEILSRTRYQHISNARHTAIAITHDLTTLTLSQIGTYFDNRDHTTIISSCNAHTKLIQRTTHANHTRNIRALLKNTPPNFQNLCPHPQTNSKFPDSPHHHFSASLTP